MARPKKVHTVEEIDSLLEEHAKGYMWLTLEESKEKALNKPIYDTIFSFFMNKQNKELANDTKIPRFTEEDLESGVVGDMLLERFRQHMDIAAEKTHSILSEADQSPYFKELDQETKKKLASILDNWKGEQLKQPRFERITQEEIDNIFANIKFVNLFYKWVMNKPTNDRPNFYSVLASSFTGISLEYALRGMAVICHKFAIKKHSKLTNREDILQAIKTELCRTGADVREATDRGDLEYLLFHPVRFKYGKSITEGRKDIENIAKETALELVKGFEKVTLSDLSYHYTSKKEIAVPSQINDLMKGVHANFVEELSKLTEKDATVRGLAGTKHYESESSDIVLDLLTSDIVDLPKKNILTDKLIRSFLKIGIAKGVNVFKQECEIYISKRDFLAMFDIDTTNEKAVYNFTYDITTQLEMLHNAGFTSKSKKTGGGAGIHIIDEYDTTGNVIYIRGGKTMLQAIFSKGYALDVSTNYANRIPTRLPMAYYLQIKIENLLGNKYNVVNDRDYSKVISLLEYLQDYKLIDLNNRRYTEKVINRFIEALDYLQNVNKSLTYYFYVDDKEHPLSQEELQPYLTKANFCNLKIWYSVPLIDEYNEEHIEGYLKEAQHKQELKLIEAKAKAKAKGKLLGKKEVEN